MMEARPGPWGPGGTRKVPEIGGGRGILGGRESRGLGSAAGAAHVPAGRNGHQAVVWGDEQEAEGSGQVGGGERLPRLGSWGLSLSSCLEKVGVEKRRHWVTRQVA